MRNFIKTTLIAVATVGAFAGPLNTAAIAQPASAEVTMTQTGEFTKKTYKVNGSWTVVQRDGQTFIKLSDDFKTKRGPDLKIFLSPSSVASVNGDNAVNGALKLGALKSNKGAQEYLVPAGVNLADYNSVLVHCEAFSKLWAAGDLS